MTKQQLTIPAPEEQDTTALSMELWSGITASIVLIALGWAFWILPQTHQEKDPFEHIEDPVQREAVRDRADLDMLYAAGMHVSADWRSSERRARAFETASSTITEFLCERQRDELKEGTLSEEETNALLEKIEARSIDAPWTCLFRIYLRDELEVAILEQALSAAWSDVETMEVLGGSMARALAVYREERHRPEDPRFYRWMRRCALQASAYPASQECRRLARQLAPEHGADLLELILLQLDEDLSTQELMEIAAALSSLAASGQPESWKVVETRALPDYDVDFRFGALHQLCRMINSANEEIYRAVGEALGRVSGITTRPTSPFTVYRWRQTCRSAFGSPESRSEPVPMLGILVEVEGTDKFRADYTMNTLIERGLCDNPEGAPNWFCGAEQWTGGGEPIRRVMGRYFAETAYVHWYEPEELAHIFGTDNSVE